MTVGAPQDMSAVNNAIVQISGGLRTILQVQIPSLATWYASQTPETLQGLGFSTSDVAMLGNLIPALENLAAVAQGQQAVQTASNFMYFPLQTLGAQ